MHEIIPPDFVSYLDEDFSTNVILKGPSGVQIQVTIVKKEDKVYMQNGWPQFLRNNLVLQDELLLFTYVGHNCYRVQIFGINWCERLNLEKAGKLEAATHICRRASTSQMTTAPMEYPSFFTIFTPEFYSEKLSIPMNFLKLTCFGERLPKEVILRTYSGVGWSVVARCIGDSVYFVDGWKQFVAENCLEEADFIFFNYDGKNEMKFRIFRYEKSEANDKGVDAKENGCMMGMEGEKGEKEEESKEEEERVMEEQDGESEEHVGQSHHRAGNAHAVGENDCMMHIVEEESEGGVEWEMEEDDDESEDSDDESEDVGGDHHRAVIARLTGKRGTSRSSATKKNGIDAKKYVHPDNPFFIAKIHHGRDNELHVPKTVIDNFSLNLPQKITLLCCEHDGRNDVPDHQLTLPEETHVRKNHRTVTAEVHKWKDGRVCYKGWARFCRINNIDLRKAECICEFVLGEDQQIQLLQRTMATVSVIISSATITMVGSATVGSSRRRKHNVHYITGLNSFGGLKAQSSVTSLGLPLCTEKSFYKVVSSLETPSQGKGRGGGAASSMCNAAGEIFQIAAILNGLVLVGVAVGFVLLRIEASVEEAAE